MVGGFVLHTIWPYNIIYMIILQMYNYMSVVYGLLIPHVYQYKQVDIIISKNQALQI